ncbi:hypothetical protein M0R01_00275 [bacterium]|nr:hypothetical protein [bacterium]
MFPFDIFPIRLNFTSPQTIFILLPVLSLELFGIVLALLGIVDDFWLLDAAFTVIVWPWLLIKGTTSRPDRKGGFVMKKAVGRQMACSLIELIPVVGTILPLWSYSVYITLKEEIISEESE